MHLFRTMLLLAVCVTFCASFAVAGISDPARDKDPQSGKLSVPDSPDNLSVKPQVYSNMNEDFQITFPAGCAKLVTRTNEPDLFGGEEWDDIVQVTYVYCDRYQAKGQGCSVKATFNLHGEDGSMAGPENVVSRVQNALKHFQANVVKQEAISKKFDNGTLVEGVEILAKPGSGPGEVWVRGMLVEGDIYILTAWNDQGGLWKNPEYTTFFNSFQPWVD
jgi:hypothetical protein